MGYSTCYIYSDHHFSVWTCNMAKEASSVRKRIIIIAVLVIALIGIYFAVDKLSVKKEEEPPTPSPSESISIFKAEKDSISVITISTPDHEYSFIKDGESWKVKGLETVKLNSSKVDSLAYDFASIYADTVIENSDDLSLYGLDKPLGTPSVKLADGSEKKFIIGNKTPIGTGYYFKTSDSDEVYTVYSSKVEGFMAKLETYRDIVLASVDATKLKEIRIKRADANIVLRVKTEEEVTNQLQGLNAWKMVSPYERDANSYNLEESILKKITSFQISKFIEDFPASYAKYGLDNPKYAIGFTEADKAPVNILLGSTVEDEIYIKLENERAVYIIKASTFSYRDINPMDLVDTLAYIQFIDKVNSIAISTNDETYLLKIVHDGENATYFVNDIAADEDAFKKAYQEVIGLFIRGEVTLAADAQPICTYVVSFNDGRADDVVELVPYQDRYAAVRINGNYNYYIMKDQVYSMLEKIKSFSQNPGKQ